MATILKSYNWDKISRNTDSRSAAYPWDDWFDGRIWKLKPEKDFTVPAFALERVIRTSANRRGMFVKVRITEDGYVIVQAFQSADEAQAAGNGKTAAKKATPVKAPAKPSLAKQPTAKTTTAKAPTKKVAAVSPAPSKKVTKKVVPASQVSKRPRRLAVIPA